MLFEGDVMAPRVKITRENIINAAVEAVRAEGIDALNARALAARLGCSTQPIFSNFSTMDEVELAVIKEANELCEEYINREVASGEYPPYKASGLAYIRFAREEKELFKLLYMREGGGEDTSLESSRPARMETTVTRNTGLRDDGAKLFHLEMWAFVHGIASMTATGFLDLEWELISKMLTDSYLGLKKHFCEE